ncbi:MAG: BON domain-containing protein [Bryobacteraceae bacterium]
MPLTPLLNKAYCIFYERQVFCRALSFVSKPEWWARGTLSSSIHGFITDGKAGNYVNLMYRLRVGLLFSIIIGCLFTACYKQSVSDNKLATGIKANLFSDAITKSANVNVAVKDGVVTLTGEVPSSDVELQAVKIVNGTAGVKRVDDQIKVNQALAANQVTPDNSSTQAPSAPATESQPVSAPSTAAAPPPPSPSSPSAEARLERTEVTIPAGERLTVRTIDTIDSDRNDAGQAFRASLASPLVSHGRVIVPTGAPVTLVLASQSDAGRIKGRSSLEIRLSRLEYRGHSYPLSSTLYEEQGKARGKQTATRTGIGAAAGAIIGAIAGGGKGAAIGSAVGGGGAVGYQLFTRGPKVKIPSESLIAFRLTAPVNIDTRG